MGSFISIQWVSSSNNMQINANKINFVKFTQKEFFNSFNFTYFHFLFQVTYFEIRCIPALALEASPHLPISPTLQSVYESGMIFLKKGDSDVQKIHFVSAIHDQINIMKWQIPF